MLVRGWIVRSMDRVIEEPTEILVIGGAAHWCLDCSAQRLRGAFPRGESQGRAGCAFRRRASAAEHHDSLVTSTGEPRRGLRGWGGPETW